MNQSLFTYSEDENMYISKDNIAYADGSEDFFINLFTSNQSRSEDALQVHIKDWATKYHLSPNRENVICHFSDLFNKEGRVLEIGAGMGAITRYLAANFKHVDCMEGSLSRAKALRARAKRMKNVDIYVGNAINANLNKNEYDLATLIGVLEYIPFYSEKPQEESVTEFLRSVSAALTDEGILVIAIENKFGLKYFSGCAEDHNGIPFSQIMDYPLKSPVTFGRNELEGLIKSAGFESVQFYHAFPDYKFPNSIFRECEEIYKLNPDIFWPNQVADNMPRRHLFFEPLAAYSIYKEKMSRFFSNSFIVLCSKSPNVNLKTNWLYSKWSNYMIKDEFQSITKILPDKGCGFFTEKRFKNGDKSRISEGTFSVNLSGRRYIHGEPMLLTAYKALLAKDNFETFVNLLKEIKTELSKFSREKDNDGYDLVSGQYFDYTFWNLVRQNGRFIYIDAKWNFKLKIPADLIIYRNITELFKRCNGYYSVYYNFVESLLSRVFALEKGPRVKYLAAFDSKLSSFFIKD
ncbi:MAG: class I SAM-dependent methyltransferase [Clostridiales bacterium]|jgi:SAM-dependent methyltransferase|nr:class I SAM-dependent methyltransferase [Clostridiales bacterium]